MSIYRTVTSELEQSGSVTTFYRFQGGQSYEQFSTKTSQFSFTDYYSYVYFSGGLAHHQYFTNKRIRQFINRELLSGTPYQVSSKSLTSGGQYSAIRDLIINSDKMQDLYSIKLITDNNFRSLIKSNCYLQGCKNSRNMVERVDRRLLGGGYGIAAEWKELLDAMTFFYGIKRISRDDLLVLLRNMKATCRVNRKENTDFLFCPPDNYCLYISQTLDSNFTRYKIMNCLEKILEGNNYNPASELGQHPQKTIDKVVADYDSNKDKIRGLLRTYK